MDKPQKKIHSEIRKKIKIRWGPKEEGPACRFINLPLLSLHSELKKILNILKIYVRLNHTGNCFFTSLAGDPLKFFESLKTTWTDSLSQAWARSLRASAPQKKLSHSRALPVPSPQKPSLSKHFLYKTAPHLCLEALERYFRVEVEGAEHLPTTGGAILLPNHSGFMGLDALLLNHWIYKNHRRLPRILLHKLWFTRGLLRLHAQRFGFQEARFENGIKVLTKKKLLILFPEAEKGNFKPYNEKYQLQKFKTGFLRMSLQTRTPIVPVLIIGAEETHINVGQISILGQLLPLPLNSFPLPAKWKIRFLEPIHLDEEFRETVTPTRLTETAAKIRAHMQENLGEELSRRKYIYFKS